MCHGHGGHGSHGSHGGHGGHGGLGGHGSQSGYPARALRALGLLLADGTPTGGRGEDFLSRQPDFFTETAVKKKSFPRWEINRHVEG